MRAIDVNMEWRRNEEARETGDPRENLPINGVVPSRFPRAKIRITFRIAANVVSKDHVDELVSCLKISSLLCARSTFPITYDETGGTAVAGRLDCSPLTKENRFQSPVGPLRIFASEDRPGRRRRSAGFLGDLRPIKSGAAPFSPQAPTSALKVTLLRAATNLFTSLLSRGHTEKPENKTLRYKVLRADKGDSGGEWISAGMKSWGKREIPEETRRPTASSGTTPTAGHRTRFTYAGGE
ncbi:hypothetical protein PR048_031480 [Dryococelus australis]|uniref:Uncharacterized protein n=1 Tax=Dryococelus australis TaxID=614101 RepID=A0ABQ9G6G0_9NEOP|nr:hypothetical protein PR048_031480 [Dryococelus australis]